MTTPSPPPHTHTKRSNTTRPLADGIQSLPVAICTLVFLLVISSIDLVCVWESTNKYLVSMYYSLHQRAGWLP